MRTNANSGKLGGNTCKPRHRSSALMSCMVFVLLQAAFVLAAAPQVSSPAQQTGDAKKLVGKAKSGAQQSGSAAAAARRPAKRDIMTFLRGHASSANALTVEGRSSTGSEAAQGKQVQMNVVHLEFPSAEVRGAFEKEIKQKVKGVSVPFSVDKFADILVDTSNPEVAGEKQNVATPLDTALKNYPPVRFELDWVFVPPPPPRGEIGIRRGPEIEPIVRGGLPELGVTGRGATIAILDTGLDFRHPDFITYDAAGRPSSRLLYLWDLTQNDFGPRNSAQPTDLKYPNGAWVGRLYTQGDLNSNLRTGNPSIPMTDLNGHGTAVASVAAGNGNAARLGNRISRGGYMDAEKSYVGVAPDADLIGVILGPNLEYLPLLSVVMDRLDSIVGGRPMVLSGSFAEFVGGRNGTTVEELEINARFPLATRGRAIVFASGNDGKGHMHAKARIFGLPGAGNLRFGWPPVEVKRQGGKVEFVCMTQLQVFFKEPALNRETHIKFQGVGNTVATDAESGFYNPYSKESTWTASIDARDGPAVDRLCHGEVNLTNDSGQLLDADVYLGRPYSNFESNAAEGQQVTMPATAASAIAVGSYDWNMNFDGKPQPGVRPPGELSSYSDPGYARAIPGAQVSVKPNIVAPGEVYAASYTRMFDGTDKPLSEEGWPVHRFGEYIAFAGTSAAAPYAAGVVALMLQKNPSLSLAQIKQILQESAKQSALNPKQADVIGPVPSQLWGWGKLDKDAVVRAVEAAGKPPSSTSGPKLRWDQPAVKLPKPPGRS